MINGEGTRPNTSDVTSPDPYDEISSWLDRKMDADDASDALSVYSSCDGSEFERYCSANSVMGTASLCSSIGTCNDFLDSDFGSSRSLRFGRSFGGAKIEFQKEDIEGANGIPGEEGGAKWRITNWTKSIPSSDGVESRHDSSTTLKGSNGNGFEFRQRFDVSTGEGSTSTTDRRRDDLLPTRAEKNKSQVDDAGNERSEFHSLLKSSGSHLCKATFEDMLIEQENGLFSGFDELESEAYDAYDRRGSEGVVEAQDHSDDDDDSVLSYGTDDERRTKLHYRQELKSKNENPLLINSSVAFGSDDWDEFIQESEQNSLASAMLAKPEEKKQQCHGTDRTFVSSSFATSIVVPNRFGSGKEPIVGDMPEPTHKVNGSDKLKQDPEDSFAQKDRLSQEVKEKRGLTAITGAAGNPKGVGDDDVSESILLQKLKLQLDPLSDIAVSHLSSPVIEEPQGKEAVILGSHEVNVLPSTDEKKINIHLKTTSAHAPASGELVKKTLPPIKVEKLDSNECYDEVVLEMEEILLDSTESHGARFPQSSRASLPQLRQPFRDGSGTASTSGTDDPYPLIQQSSKVDWVEVIGAKQKKGDVSFGERIVGVKEYTVYSLRVWSGKDQWEVERRYRDFFTLFRQLKNLFADHGQALPSPWSRVEQESRKIFGNASPGVVSQRSALIQECLRSILHSGVPHSTQSVLIWFLSPQKVASSSSMSNAPRSGSVFTAETSTEDVSFLGKTISLLVETQPRKPVKQLLEAQHYSCAGCHKRLDAEKTLVLEFVQTLGWGKPRLCEYTGQLFCASCHTNETAVLPAKVLHFWDFTEYPVSQLAKSYLESIYDQPMLCVSAVNPFLFAKVPSLLRVMGFRKKIGAMMPYLRCPFRRSIQRGVGSRRYLLESTEFFALRDLVDLSKGAFSALPVMVETIFKKILEHITQRCLVCCDVGIPCCARQACEDPSSLIFPFQEDEIKRCSSCQLVFHKPCFKKLSNCPCGANIELRDSATSTNLVKGMSSNEFDAVLENSVGKPAPGSSAGFLSSLFSNAKQEVWGSKKGNPVILMGPLPNTFSDPL